MRVQAGQFVCLVLDALWANDIYVRKIIGGTVTGELDEGERTLLIGKVLETDDQHGVWLEMSINHLTRPAERYSEGELLIPWRFIDGIYLLRPKSGQQDTSAEELNRWYEAQQDDEE